MGSQPSRHAPWHTPSEIPFSAQIVCTTGVYEWFSAGDSFINHHLAGFICWFQSPNSGVCVFGGVGERTREGNDLYTEMVDSKVINLDNLTDSKVALIYGQMNCRRVGLSALTVAEYFREELQQDVLLFIDNIFRFVQAGSEVSALLGRLTSAVGY